jgi:ABC-type sugar transport system ATPase subunit
VSKTRPATRSEADLSHTVVLEAHGLARSFGATRALVDGDLVVHQGEVVALLGENGSGKSTFVKLLSGVIVPDAGVIAVWGEPKRFRSPRAAIRSGIVTVFQEILVAPDLSVLDNLWLGNGSTVRRRRRIVARADQARELLTALDPKFPQLSTPVRELDIMQRQVAAIVRALLCNPQVLVLDESTSALDVSIRDRLFEVVRQRCAAGMAAIFISHRMDEVLTFADRFVALRSGSTVGDVVRADATADGLVSLISGDIDHSRSQAGSRDLESAPTAIEILGARVRPGTAPLDLTVRRGEILGLAGLEGQGQGALLRSLAGLDQLVTGTIRYLVDGEEIVARRYEELVRAGVAYVPRDRKVDGLADILSILDNYAMPTLRKDTSFGFLRSSRTRRRLAVDAERVNFRPGAQASAGRLSGGNQQKVIIARWLATRPRVLLLNDPTRGVDVKTKGDLYALFRELAEEGLTIVLLSSEVEELVGLTDRVVVYHAGSCSAVLSGNEIARERLVSAYFSTDEDRRSA